MTVAAYDVLLRDSRHPGAAAAREAADWLSWLELGGATPATLFTYQWTLDKLLEKFPDVPYREFTDGHLMAFLKGFPEKSRKARSSPLRSWFEWGEKTRRIQPGGNPCDLLPTFKRNVQPIVEVFTIPEEAALRALPEPDGTLMALLLDTGMRKGEARNLQWKRVDFDREQVLIIDGAKGGKQRVVPIDQESAPMLLGRLNGLQIMEGLGRDDFLWYDRPGGRGPNRHRFAIGNHAFHRWWTVSLAAAGVRYRKPHTARHSYATRMRQLGLDLGDIQELLGHASVATTQQIYVHQTTDDIRARIAALRAKD